MPDQLMVDKLANLLVARCERIGRDRLAVTARVILEMLRDEPNEDMVFAAEDLGPHYDPETYWRAMLDAALFGRADPDAAPPSLSGDKP